MPQGSNVPTLKDIKEEIDNMATKITTYSLSDIVKQFAAKTEQELADVQR